MATLEHWLLPDGIEEVLPGQAARIEAIRRRVLDLFDRWGYAYVITPYVEFLESLLTGAGQDLELRTFKVSDPRSGRQMGLRADITPQVARIDAHAMQVRGPNRLCYAGSVLHTQPRDLSASRSPIQLGAELYGDASQASDIEVISLMLEVLAVAGIGQVHMDLGHVGVFRGLLRAAALPKAREHILFDVLQRKATDELRALGADLPAPLTESLLALVELCGEREVLDEARSRLAKAPPEVARALDELTRIADGLAARYPQLPLYFDLAELRGYHYHTGTLFAAFVPGLGQAIAQGGRYDDIGADFGRARPATGFSTDLKALVGWATAAEGAAQPAIWAPDDADPDLWRRIQGLRAQGARVIQALPGQDLADARTLGCDRRLYWRDGRWQLQPLPSADG